jgi:putative heme-binding domain-containing protein
VAETPTGRCFVGILADENPTTFVFKQANGVPFVLPRANVQSLGVQPWSLMPEGLEQDFSTQDLADLLEYVIPR